MEYLSGRLSRTELRKYLENVEAPTNVMQTIILKLNLIMLDLQEFLPDEDFDEGFIDELLSIASEVENAKIPHLLKKCLLMQYGDLLSTTSCKILTTMAINTKIMQTMSLIPMNQERRRKLELVTAIKEKGQSYIRSALKVSSEHPNNKELSGYSNFFMSKSFADSNYCLLSAGVKLEKTPDDRLEVAYYSALKSYNIFNKAGMRPSVYKALLLAREIYIMSDRWAEYNLNHILKLSELESAISSFQNEDYYNSDNSSVVENSLRMLDALGKL